MVWNKKKPAPQAKDAPLPGANLKPISQQALLATSAAIAAAAPGVAEAATFNVSDQASFAAALAAMAADRSSDHTINFTASFTMSAPVAPIVAEGGAVITINGNGFTIDGASSFRPFFIYSGEVNIADLGIANASAQGGDGAGGGMGAGGGVFVNSLAVVSLTNVSFTNSSAIGGDGGQQYQGGGGGLGGDGGEESGGGGGGLYGDGGDGSEESGGGGGGALGQGGASSTPTDYGGGGGGGFFGDGGQGRGHEFFGAGGGGGGFTADGTNGGPGQSVPGQGGGAEGGDGSPLGVNAQDAQGYGGGGGGGGPDGGGGDGEFGGGGGGAGGTTDLNLDPSQETGGQGGVFGGGGGSDEGGGGDGGDFGGGGGLDTGGVTQSAGDGGYGGGGGGADPDGGGTGGAGGFGGGRGFGAGGGVGNTGFGGGDATATGGGGGAGFGGAIFVREGGTLIIREGVTLSGGSVSGGAGVNGGGSGAALAEGIFIQSGDLTFDIGAGSTTVSDVIGDATGNGADAGALVKTGAGTLILQAANTYSGGTTISGGIVRIENNAAFGTGGVTLGPGAIDYANGIDLANAITLAAQGGLNVDTGGATQSGAIGGTGGIDKTGAGALTLSGVNTFLGATNVNAGTLILSGGLALADVSAVTIASGATLQLNDSETIGSLAGDGNVDLGANTLTTGGDGTSTIFSGDISGAGGLDKIGAGDLTLSGTNTYLGATNIIAGALTLAGGSAIADTGIVTIASGATLALDDSEEIGSVSGAGSIDLDDNTLTTGSAGSTTFSGDITGSGGLTKVGAGTFTLTGANTYTGETNINAGTLAVSGGQAISDQSAVTVASGATLELNGSEAIGSLAGAGNVNLNANTLTTGADGTSTTFAGVISGAGGLTKIGAGVLTLSGANTYGGGTILAGGTIRVENDAAFGTGDVVTTGSTIDYANGVTIANGIVLMSDPTLNVDVGSAEQAGAISESGGVHGITKTGAGTLVLSGANTFTGATNIDEGTLALTGGLALSDVTTVTIASGAALQLNDSETIGAFQGGGNIDLGSNTLTAGGTNASTTFSGIISGLGGLNINGTGTLTLSGANTYQGGTTLTGGAIRVENDSALGTGDLTASGATLDYAGGVTIANGIVLLSDIDLNVDLGAAIQAGAISGGFGIDKTGTGTLTLSGVNTYTGATTISAGELILEGGLAIADVSAVTVASGAQLTLNDSETIGSLAGAGDVELNANTLTTGGDGTSTLFSGVISGAGGLTKIGAGALTLSGANTYAGATNVNGGTLVLQGGAALSDASAVTIASGATLQLDDSEIIGSLAGAGDVDLAANTLTTGADGTSTEFSGVISGAGGLAKIGAGIFTLSGANTYGGETNVSAGTLILDGGLAIADAGLVTVASGANLQLNDSETIGALQGAGGVDLGSNTLTTGGIGANTTFAGAITGLGGLTKEGAGAFTLSGVNTFSGATNINAGTLILQGGLALADVSAVTVASGATLQLGDDETIGSLAGGGDVDLGNNTLTTGADSTNTLFSGEIFGAGGLTKIGAGIFTLSGANTYTGATNVNAGALVLQGGLAIADTSAVIVASGASLELDASEAIGSLAGGGGVELNGNTLTTGGDGSSTTFAGIISGAGGLTKVGAGTFTLTGANTYTGETNINAGELVAAGGAAIADQSAVTVASGAQFTLNDNEVIGSLAGAGDVELNGNTLTTGFNGASTLFSGLISGAGGLTKIGAGVLTLSGANSYTGATTITGGELIASGGAAITDQSTVDVALGAAFTLNNSETIGALMGAGDVNLGSNTLTTGANGSSTTFAGVIGGAGGIVKIGAGVFTLTGVNTYAGATQILEGTLEADGGAAISDQSAVTVASGAAFTLLDNEAIGSLSGAGNVQLNANTLTTGFDNTSTLFSGVIAGAGGLTKVGTGEFTLSGVNTFTGDTLVLGGTLTLDNAQALLSDSIVTINAPATLSLGASVTLGGLFGDGAVALGVNTLTIDAASDSTFSGAIGGSGGLVKDGAAVFVLNGVNTFTGGTEILEGALVLDGGSALSDIGAVTVASGATLELAASEAIGSLAGGGNVDLNASTLTVGGDNASTIFSGVLSGAGGVTKVGTGVFTLSGANTYDGPTNVDGGTLVLDGGNALVDSALVNVGPFGTLELASGETIGGLNGAGVVVLGGNVLTIGGGDTSSAFAGSITGAGGLTKIGTGSFALTGPNTFAGPVIVSNGQLVLDGGAALSDLSAVTVSSPGILSLGASEMIGSLQGDGAVDLGAFFLWLGNDNTSTAFSGLISGAGGIVKLGSGAFTLSGANTYAGGTILAGGTLRVEHNDALGTGAVTTTGSVIDYAAGVTISNPIVLMSFPDLNVDTGAAEQAGSISESGGVYGIFKTGAGTLTLSGTNTYTGATIVSAGTLALAGGAAIADTGVVLVDTGAAIALVDDETISDLTGDGAVHLSDDTLTLAGLGFYEFAGAISGTGGLVILAGGEVELSGASSFSGGVVNDGLLVLSSSTAAGTGAIVNNDALLFSDSLANAISGTGFIQKFGAGFAELTGTNTHDGGTVVAGGVLRAGVAQLGTGQLSILANTTFELNQATDATLGIVVASDPLSVFAQIGPASITYTGGAFGDFNVLDGTANVMGAIGVLGANGMTIANGAALTGTGVIVGDVTNAGIVSPAGDSIGVLTIQGDYVHQASGLLRIQFDPGGNIDLLAVTGTATINGGAVELLSLGGADGSGLTFLSAAGGVNGTFDALWAPSGGAASILYNANSAQISPTVATARPSTPNSQLAMVTHSTDELLDLIADELEENRDAGVLWGRSLFGEIERDAHGASRGFDYSSRGGVGGVRTRRINGFAVGVALAKTEGEANLELDAGSTESNAVMGALYADWRSENFMISGGITVGETDFDTRRRVILNSTALDIYGDSEASTSGMHLGLSNAWEVGGWRLTASGRMNYVSAKIDAYNEDGLNLLRLGFDSFEAEAVVSRVRLGAQHRIEFGDRLAMTPSISLGAVHEAALGERSVDATFLASGAGIRLNLDGSPRTMGEAGLGLTFHVGDRFEFGASAAYLTGEDQQGAYGAISGRLRF